MGAEVALTAGHAARSTFGTGGFGAEVGHVGDALQVPFGSGHVFADLGQVAEAILFR